MDAADVLTLTINGETATNKLIKIDIGDMPFTLSGLAMTSLAIATSDQRHKTEIADSDLGLSFINRLRPIKYKWRNFNTSSRSGIHS